MFDQLVRQTDEAERKVIDEIIRDRDEFAVYVDLSSRFGVMSAASEQPATSTDTSERRGLAWVMALARVEVGAMLAGFTKVHSPFSVVGPTEHESSAYRELLTDGMRTHYLALARDPKLRQIVAESATKPGSETLAYVRRISVAREFLNAAGQVFPGGKLSPLTTPRSNVRPGRRGGRTAAAFRIAAEAARQSAESQQLSLEPTQSARQPFRQQASQYSSQPIPQVRWQADLQQLQQGLTANINRYLSHVQRISHAYTKTGDKSLRLMGACSRQLAGERYELQQGLARIETTDLN